MACIGFVGESTLLIRCFEAVINDGHQVHFVHSSDSAVCEYVSNAEIRLVSDWSELSTADLESIDFLFSAGHLQVIPSTVLDAVKGQVLNFHDGPLPQYAGLHVTTWALLNGEESHAVSWHLVTDELDAGEIAASVPFLIAPNETALSLNLKCFEHGARVFSDVLLPQLKTGKIASNPQESGPRSLYTRHQKPYAGGVLCWDQTRSEIESLKRALSFGGYDNPVASIKVLLGGQYFTVLDLHGSDWQADSVAGTVVSTDGALSIVCADGVIEITRLAYLTGNEISIAEALKLTNVSKGAVLAFPDEHEANRLESVLSEASRAENAIVQYGITAQNFAPLSDIAPREESSNLVTGQWQSVENLGAKELSATVLAFFALMQANGELACVVDIGQSIEPILGKVSPVFVTVNPDETISSFMKAAAIAQPVPADAMSRRRIFSEAFPQIAIVSSEAALDELPSVAIGVELDATSGRFRLHIDAARVSIATRERILRELMVFCTGVAANPAAPLKAQPIIDEIGLKAIERFNSTACNVDFSNSVHYCFSERALTSSDDVAVECRGKSITYDELENRSSGVARLLHERGVGPGSHVGICVGRSIDLVVALLAVLKSGAAYVPLDPEFPIARLKGMVEDVRPEMVIVDGATGDIWSDQDINCCSISQIEMREDGFAADISSDSLAYTMFTSGSSGRPKGVAISHRNLLNFFAGMDAVLSNRVAGTWLSVTSLSFDISVLELLWTLLRGFRVILFDHTDGIAPSERKIVPKNARAIGFSLSYFASETSEFNAREGYSLLFEGVEFADNNGFEAVWTPERHFHEFGGLFPNPAVTSAALAARTKNIGIRAGSVVLPLHHPVRAAEDWALVDQISNGRAGVSFASGWQERDFVLRPESFHGRKQEMIANIETVRRLWAGDTLEFAGVDSAEVSISIKPLPVQKSIPVWVTAAGNPETFRMAGEAGHNVLTHLLGQSVSELQGKIQIYRDAYEAAGHTGYGKVTVMVHTFVGTESATVRDTVYEPLTNYLKTAVGLIKQAPYAFPIFKKPSETIARKVEEGIRDFSPQEIAQLTDFAFDRYFEASGLFGTVEQCVEQSLALHAAGADEIACLIDFGVSHEQVIQSLPLLNEVRKEAQRRLAQDGYSLAEILEREKVTHFQSTPSLIELVADSERACNALGNLEVLMLGGEPLKQATVDTLRRYLNGELLNMYGPTETTIWSSVSNLRENNWQVCLGSPIANTGIYIVDDRLRLVTPGTLGEVLITGEGLSAGYAGKPEMTAERFIDITLPSGVVRAYRTGDYGRISQDGFFEFAGRKDGQVKISGYRIELGEVESALLSLEAIQQVVVVAAEAGLKSYFKSKSEVCPLWLREKLSLLLPDYMIPFQFIRLGSFPLTPNGKIDRVGLASRVDTPRVPETKNPDSTLLGSVQTIWASILGLETVDPDTNLFDMGANSLMVVQAAVQLRELLSRDVALVDLFQNPTIGGFVLSIGTEDSPVHENTETVQRVSKRKAFLARRQGQRS